MRRLLDLIFRRRHHCQRALRGTLLLPQLGIVREGEIIQLCHPQKNGSSAPPLYEPWAARSAHGASRRRRRRSTRPLWRRRPAPGRRLRRRRRCSLRTAAVCPGRRPWAGHRAITPPTTRKQAVQSADTDAGNVGARGRAVAGGATPHSAICPRSAARARVPHVPCAPATESDNARRLWSKGRRRNAERPRKKPPLPRICGPPPRKVRATADGASTAAPASSRLTLTNNPRYVAAFRPSAQWKRRTRWTSLRDPCLRRSRRCVRPRARGAFTFGI